MSILFPLKQLFDALLMLSEESKYYICKNKQVKPNKANKKKTKSLKET